MLSYKLQIRDPFLGKWRTIAKVDSKEDAFDLAKIRAKNTDVRVTFLGFVIKTF